MSLEPKFDFIDDLNQSNPDNTPDQVAQADDHMRGIKKSVKGSWPNLGQGAVTWTYQELNDLPTKTGAETFTNKIISAAQYLGVQLGFIGDIAGNATTATTAAKAGAFTTDRTVTATGDVTGTSTSDDGNHALGLTIPDGSITEPKVADNAISFTSKIKRSTVHSQFTANGTLTSLGAGVWNLKNDSTSGGGVGQPLEIHLTTGSETAIILVPTQAGIQLVSDGTNVKYKDNGGSDVPVKYTRMFI